MEKNYRQKLYSFIIFVASERMHELFLAYDTKKKKEEKKRTNRNKNSQNVLYNTQNQCIIRHRE